MALTILVDADACPVKELQGYSIVRRTHVSGDRRDHFTAETDLWDMTMRIVAERKKREIDPTIALLREIVATAGDNYTLPAHVRERLGRMHEFMDTLSTWYEQVRVLPKPTLLTLMKR